MDALFCKARQLPLVSPSFLIFSANFFAPYNLLSYKGICSISPPRAPPRQIHPPPRIRACAHRARAVRALEAHSPHAHAAHHPLACPFTTHAHIRTGDGPPLRGEDEAKIRLPIWPQSPPNQRLARFAISSLPSVQCQPIGLSDTAGSSPLQDRTQGQGRRAIRLDVKA